MHLPSTFFSVSTRVQFSRLKLLRALHVVCLYIHSGQFVCILKDQYLSLNVKMHCSAQPLTFMRCKWCTRSVHWLYNANILMFALPITNSILLTHLHCRCWWSLRLLPLEPPNLDLWVLSFTCIRVNACHDEFLYARAQAYRDWDVWMKETVYRPLYWINVVCENRDVHSAHVSACEYHNVLHRYIHKYVHTYIHPFKHTCVTVRGW